MQVLFHDNYANAAVSRRVIQVTDQHLLLSGALCAYAPACNCCLQDKINAFWEITKKELEDRKAEMRNHDRQMEEMEDLHQRELKVPITAQQQQQLPQRQRPTKQQAAVVAPTCCYTAAAIL
jgi:hypothetical protein